MRRFKSSRARTLYFPGKPLTQLYPHLDSSGSLSSGVGYVGYAGLAAFGHPLLDRDASRTSRERRIGSSLSRRSSMSVTDVSRCISQSEGGSSRARFLYFPGKPLPQLYPHCDSSGSLSSGVSYITRISHTPSCCGGKYARNCCVKLSQKSST